MVCLDSFKPIMRVFYEINKIAMNFYWLIGLKWLLDGRIGTYGLFMLVISFLYFVSNMLYFLPENIRIFERN
jgi:hypothetical protein